MVTKDGEERAQEGRTAQVRESLRMNMNVRQDMAHWKHWTMGKGKEGAGSLGYMKAC